MYSYEERLRAVKLYLTLGKRCKATINQLGYPTKNALKTWHDEFERRGDLQAGYARSKPKYSDEQRNVEDWELEEWCKVASPFLLAYASLKGVTGLRKQDMLTIKRSDISDTELTSINLKTGKKIRFPLYDKDCQPTTVKLAIDDVQDYYRSIRNRRVPVISQFLFHNRRGGCYWNFEKATCSGFDSIWQRHMDKALAETKLQERFTDHDLRSKVASDLDTDQEASALLAHSSLQITRKHYRLKGQLPTGEAGHRERPHRPAGPRFRPFCGRHNWGRIRASYKKTPAGDC